MADDRITKKKIKRIIIIIIISSFSFLNDSHEMTSKLTRQPAP